MSSSIGTTIAASKAREAASPNTDLREPSAKRQRNRPARDDTSPRVAAASGDVDAAERASATDGAALVRPPCEAAESVQVLLGDGPPNVAESDQATSIRDLLVERLLLVLTGSSSFPAKSEKPLVNTKVNLGLLKAVEEAVEHAWHRQKAELPRESGLKPKAHAWLVADVVGDPFLPSEEASRLGKAMQTRVAALRRDEKLERDRSSSERRAAEKAAEEGNLEGELDAVRRAIVSRLHARLDALHSSVYPAYANACRPLLDAASQSPVAAAAETAETADAKTADARANADVHDADSSADSSAHLPHTHRTRSSKEACGYDDWQAGYDEGLAAAWRDHPQRRAEASRYYEERLEISKLHEKELDLARAQARLQGQEEILLDVMSQVEVEVDKIDKGPQHLFSARDVANALLLLRAWAEEQHGPLQEQLDQAMRASHDAMWETAAKEQPPWWALA